MPKKKAKKKDEAKKPEDEAKKLQDEAKKLQDEAKKLQNEVKNNPTLYTTDEDVNKLFDPFIIINAYFYTIVNNVTPENNSDLNDYIDNTFKYTFEKIKNLYITITYLVNGLLQDATYNKSLINSNINDKILILGSVKANFIKIRTLLKNTEDVLLLYKNNSQIKKHLYNCIICEKRAETYIKTASAYLDINNIKAYENAYEKYENAKDALTYLYNLGDPAKKKDIIPNYIKVLYNNYVSNYEEAKTAHEEAKRLFYFNKKDEKTQPIYIFQFLDKIEDNITEIDILKNEIPLIYDETELANASVTASQEPEPEAPTTALQPEAQTGTPLPAAHTTALQEQLQTGTQLPEAPTTALQPEAQMGTPLPAAPLTNQTESSDDIFDSNDNVSEQYRKGAELYVRECRIYKGHENANSCSQTSSLKILHNVIRLIFDYCSEYYDNIGECRDIFTEGGKTLTFYKIFLHKVFNDRAEFNARYTTLTKLYNDDLDEVSHLLSIKIVESPNIDTYNSLIFNFNHYYEGTSPDIKIYIVGMKDGRVDLKIYEMTKNVSNIPVQFKTQLKYILYLGNASSATDATDATDVPNGNNDVNFRIKRVIYVFSKTIDYSQDNILYYLYKIHPKNYANEGFTENILYCLYNIDFITFTKDYLDYIVEKGKETETETIKPKTGILPRLRALFVSDENADKSSRTEAINANRPKRQTRQTRTTRSTMLSRLIGQQGQQGKQGQQGQTRPTRTNKAKKSK